MLIIFCNLCERRSDLPSGLQGLTPTQDFLF